MHTVSATLVTAGTQALTATAVITVQSPDAPGAGASGNRPAQTLASSTTPVENPRPNESKLFPPIAHPTITDPEGWSLSLEPRSSNSPLHTLDARWETLDPFLIDDLFR